MKIFTTIKLIVLSSILLLPGDLYAQCFSPWAFGGAIAPNTPGTTTTISTCNFQEEYSEITSVVAGEDYIITNDIGGCATVTHTTPTGTVVAFGTVPYAFTATVSGTYYIHWTVDCGPSCALDNFFCCVTTIECQSCVITPNIPAGGIPISIGGTVNACTGTFWDSGGNNTYGYNENYTTTICSGSSDQITMDFSAYTFGLQANNDVLYIYDGNLATGTALWESITGNGTVNPGAITSSTGCLTFEFISDGVTINSGWGADISCPSCTDGIQNGNETDIDCGGSGCAACPNCFNGIQDGNETGIDCGPSCAQPCHCTDGVLSGDETNVDCGGSCLQLCPVPCAVTITANSSNGAGGCYSSTVTEASPVGGAGATNTLSFTGTPSGALGNGTLTVTVYGDIDGIGTNLEQYDIYDEQGNLIGSAGATGNFADQCGTGMVYTINLTAAQIDTWAADGTINFDANPTTAVSTTLCGGDYVQMALDYCTPNTNQICGAVDVNLVAVGVGTYTYILNNNFDDGTAGTGWNTNITADYSNPCDPSLDMGSYMWMGNTAPHPRIIETTGLDLTCGGEVCFFLDFATQGNAQPCEGIDLANEGV